MANDSTDYGFNTRAIHSGYSPDHTGAVVPPIHQSAGYVFKDAQHGANLFQLKEMGFSYSRLTNPTNEALQLRMAALEGGTGATVASSGHAAQLLAFLAVMSPGKHIVASSRLYGGSVSQLKNTFPMSFGWQTTFVDPDEPQNFADAITEDTRAIFVESIANPSGVITDMEAIAKVADEHGIPFIVDNTIATPYLCRPIEFGANIVTHSTTKYLSGNGTAIGGVVVEGGNFDWGKYADKFPQLAQPISTYNGMNLYESFGNMAVTIHAHGIGLRDVGPSQAPFQSWLTMLGIETLHIRMERHCENAKKVAKFLKGHPNVAWVSYSGLEDSKYFPLAQKYMKNAGTSALFMFGVKGGYDEAESVVQGTKLFSMVANIGDSRSLIIHPAGTTHAQLAPEEMKAVGVNPETIRLSIGLEDCADIIADLDQALNLINNRKAA